MKRRDFISGTAAAALMTSLAGCGSQVSQDGLTLTEQDAIQPLEYSVSITSKMSEDTPPTLDVEVTNTGDTEITLGDSRDLFTFSSGSYRTEVLNIADVEYTDAGWYKPERTARTTEFQTITLEPGQSESRTVYVIKTQQDVSSSQLDYPQRFEPVVTTQTQLNGISEGERVEWEFTLTRDILLPSKQ